ncbi:MAG: hypothetical protein A2046_07170 [Bacteroidetes bacterium GWA2_30_7]|nr:MAG: hypothetical protein A2046_07170 [Bacteroidetes bacterium GWA2_30_7]
MKNILTLALQIIVTQLFSQNLVPNPSFELFEKCPQAITTVPRLDLVKDWYIPTMGTPDYFNECSVKCGVPFNWAGQRPAFDGKAYIGIITKWDFELKTNANCRREYIEAKLIEPLQKNVEYCIKFYVVLADNCQFATDGLGTYFSANKLDSVDFNGNFPYHPQIQNITNNLIYSDGTWVEICGKFKATGNEEFITIGNFKSDPETRWANRTKDLTVKYAYYYIDNVSVTPIEIERDCKCSKEMTEFNNKNQKGKVDDAEIVRFDINKLNIGQSLFLNNVQFLRNEPELEPSLIEELNLFIKFMTEYPTVKVKFSTYADIEIPEENRPKIINARNNTVLEYFAAKGIAPERLTPDNDAPVRVDTIIEFVITEK